VGRSPPFCFLIIAGKIEMPYLMSDGDKEIGQRFNLGEDEVHIGRHPDCHVVIDDAAVSRHHARITNRDGKYLIEDLKSRNGTFLNRRLVQQPTRLLNGDRIRICDHGFTFFLEESIHDSRARNTQEASIPKLESSILLDDRLGSDLSVIQSKLEMGEMDSQHSGSAFAAKPEIRLQALISISKALGTAISLDMVLPRVLESLFELFRLADRGFVVLAEPDGELRPLAVKLRRDEPNATFRISRTIINHVIQTRSAVISHDAATDDRFDLSQSMIEFRIRSVMCAPLMGMNGQCLGAIQLDSSRSGPGFAAEDLEILATVAIQAAAAIDRARVHEMEITRQRNERDMELANEVQLRLLPAEPPVIRGYRLFDFYRPADAVGGDYFDYIELPDGRIAILIGDVVGHGIAAALLMAKVSAEARFALATQSVPCEAMDQLNRAICRLQLERFITIAMCVLNPEAHSITVVNAGHLPPVVRAPDGKVRVLSTEFSGLPVGITDELTYKQQVLELAPGNLLAIFTDGITESPDTAQNQFGNGQVVSIMEEKNWKDAADFGNALINRHRQHTAGALQEDDICLVCLSRDA
jgi:phosphoserine phosphatase RsbU/P